MKLSLVFCTLLLALLCGCSQPDVLRDSDYRVRPLPNPFEDVLGLNLDVPYEQDVNILVWGAASDPLMKSSLTVPQNGVVTTLDFRDEKEGAYVIEVQFENVTHRVDVIHDR